MFQGEPRRRALGDGAARAAPTAPHATPPQTGARGWVAGRKSGPERFWSRGWLGFAACLILSGTAHYAVVPFELPHGLEIEDVEGEAAIPIEVLTAEAPPAEAPPAEPPPPQPNKADDDEKAKEAAAAARLDAGATHDAATPQDSSAPEDAAVRDAAPTDGAAVDAESDASPGDSGAVAAASTDAGPNAMVGAALQVDVVLVEVVVNAAVIRKHPVGAKMGFLLRGIPQWDEFMSGTDIDPVRDADWVQISGPSLINTARDVVLVHYSVPDAVIDRAVDVVSHKYDRGGRYDTGVPGVRASLAHADRSERVLMRAQPHLLAVVPPAAAQRIARQLITSRLPAENHPGEAVYLKLANPHHPIPELPEAITEMRLRAIPRPDLGVDVFIDGDTKDPEAATGAAEDLRRFVRRHDDALTSMVTHGLLDHVETTTEGSMVKTHLVVTLDQLETLVALVSGFLGVQPDLPQAPVAPASPRPTHDSPPGRSPAKVPPAP